MLTWTATQEFSRIVYDRIVSQRSPRRYWHMHMDQAEVISFVVGLIVGYLLRGRYPNILHR